MGFFYFLKIALSGKNVFFSFINGRVQEKMRDTHQDPLWS